MNRAVWSVLVLLALQGSRAPADLIVGAWHGTSLCADKRVDTACNDEEALYVIDSAAGPRGPVRWQADKIVNGERVNMGISRLTYDSAAANWSWEFQARLRGRFTLAVHGDSLVGDLREGPSRRLVRRIVLTRCSSRIPQCPK